MESTGGQCFECARQAPLFSRAVAYGGHDGELRQFIHLLKYEHVRSAAKVLGQWTALAADGLLEELGDRVVVVPVPLHKAKFVERGFNQSELIAQSAVRELARVAPGKFELDVRVLIRRRRTESQVGMTLEQRRTNLKGAFEVRERESIRGREVLLVDDVMTTGATVNECSRVLLKAGATRVWVATAARAVKLSVLSASYLHREEESLATARIGFSTSSHAHSN